MNPCLNSITPIINKKQIMKKAALIFISALVLFSCHKIDIQNVVIDSKPDINDCDDISSFYCHFESIHPVNPSHIIFYNTIDSLVVDYDSIGCYSIASSSSFNNLSTDIEFLGNSLLDTSYVSSGGEVVILNYDSLGVYSSNFTGMNIKINVCN